MFNLASIPSAITSQALQGHTQTHRHRGGGSSAPQSTQQSASTGISSLTSLLGATPNSSSTAISTAATSLFNNLPGFSSGTNSPSTNVVV